MGVDALAIGRRVAALAGWRRAFLAFAAGALMTVGQPPLSIPWVIFLSVPLLVLLMDGAQGRGAAALIGWAAGFGYFLTGLYWIGEAFLVDAETYAWMAPFAVALLAAGLALFWMLAMLLARYLWRPGPWRVLVLAASLTLVEFARGNVLTGFPWALPAYAWVETPIMQAAHITGSYGLTLLTLAAGGLAVLLMERRWTVAAAATALVAAGWIWGEARLSAPYPERADPIALRIVQPNIPQREKWRGDLAQRNYDILTGLTASPGPQPDLVIWPETAVPFRVAEEPALQVDMASHVPGDATLITGSLHVERGETADRWTNSLFAIDAAGAVAARYDKKHLVPFGEYLPMQSLLESIGLRQLTQLRGGFAIGGRSSVISLDGVAPFAALICYEAIFPGEVRAISPRPDWIVQITNDAWFGSSSGPYQHFAQARVRAIETGLPVARAANTGVSAIIDGRGRVVEMAPLGGRGILDGELPAALNHGVYYTLGDTPWLAITLLILILSKFYRSPTAIGFDRNGAAT